MDVPELTTPELLEQLLEVRSTAVMAERRRRGAIDALPAERRASAANLMHYLGVRSVDLRGEQRALAARGLSSLGRAEAHILATLDAVLVRLSADVALGGESPVPQLPDDIGSVGPTADEGRGRLRSHAVEALGPTVGGRHTRVMVTMPSEAATDAQLIDGFVAAGMNVARINGAHDGPETWRTIAHNVRRSADAHGREVRIAFDLAGPKLRTGPIEEGPAVLKLRPERDGYGRVVRPARFVLAGPSFPGRTAEVGLPFGPLTTVPVDDGLWRGAALGDRIRFVDARGRKRSVTVAALHDGAIEVEADRTIYLTSGLRMRRQVEGDWAVGSVRTLPPTSSFIELNAGDLLELRRGSELGRSAVVVDGKVEMPAHVGVEVPELFTTLGDGDRVLLDDGLIETVVRHVEADVIALEVLRPERAKLRAEKGINVPDVVLPIVALTDADLDALEVAVSFADMVAFSFVRSSENVTGLHDQLDRLGAQQVGVILKIEHRAAFEQLPELLLASMRRPPAAVMVARGDLAVEIGYERLAEVQEEILWLCEAAHVPVIWATQVLESLAKRGAPTRAEVTDAAWSSRAECVMLNKGPFIEETIRFLDDILGRMQKHQSKRTPMMRRLSVAGGLSDS